MKEAQKHLPEGERIEENFGPRNMGAGPGGLAGMNIKTGEIKYVASVPFQVGHVQCNPWVPGQIVFCWETGGKSPQRTWIVNPVTKTLPPTTLIRHSAPMVPKSIFNQLCFLKTDGR